MMFTGRRQGGEIGRVLLAFALVLAAGGHAWALGDVKASYLYELSDFSGTVPYHWPILTVDAENREVYVLDRKERDIRVYGETGMEIYRYGQGGSLGFLLDIASGGNGEIFAVAREPGAHPVLRFNYRGAPLERIEVRGLPAGFSKFQAERVVCRGEHLYLADEGNLQVVMTSRDGVFERGYDLPTLLDFASADKKKTEAASIDGLDVDEQGNLWLTIATLFSAFRVSPEGHAVGFGTAGGAKGKFGVIGEIAAGDDGLVYVTDRLRCVVLVFDRKLQFLKEFGYRGAQPRNLIVPRTIALNSRLGRIFIGQAGNRGVSVYQVARH